MRECRPSLAGTNAGLPVMPHLSSIHHGLSWAQSRMSGQDLARGVLVVGGRPRPGHLLCERIHRTTLDGLNLCWLPELLQEEREDSCLAFQVRHKLATDRHIPTDGPGGTN